MVLDHKGKEPGGVETKEMVLSVPAKKHYPEGGVAEEPRELVAEHFMELEVNGQSFARIACLARDLDLLVLGRLYAEGLIESREDVKRIFICAQGYHAEAELAKPVSLKKYCGPEGTCCSDNVQLLEKAKEPRSGSAGGIFREGAGKEDLRDDLTEGTERFYPEMSPGDKSPVEMSPGDKTPGDRIPVDQNLEKQIFSLAEHFKADSALHKRTFGTHSAYLMERTKGLIAGFEDISRHNALDKAIGHMVSEGYDPRNCILFTTGRVPEDMVRKCAGARVPILVSKSVPTAAGVRLAGELGVKLIGSAWPDSFVEY